MTYQPYFQDRPYRISGELTHTDIIMNNTFWIGVYPGLSEERLDFVVEKLGQYFGASIMNTALKKQSIHLFIDVKIPKNTIANINKVYVQEAIRILLQSDLEALAGESPEEILQKFRFFFAKK